jgi:ribose transport system substrate-binding protein
MAYEVKTRSRNQLTGQVGQRPFEMGYKTMKAFLEMKEGKPAPQDPTYTGLDVCTPETVDTCIAK